MGQNLLWFPWLQIPHDGWFLWGHLLIELGTSWHIPLLVNWKAHHQKANLVICCLRAASCQSIDSTRWYKAEIAIPWLATLCVIHSDFLALEKGRTKQHETTIWHQLTSNFDLKSSDYHLPAPDKMVQRYARIYIYMLIRAPGISRTWTSWYWCTDTLKNFS